MAIAGAVGLVRGLGPEPCAAYLEKLIDAITKVASGEALCQLAEEDEEEMEEEEEQEVGVSLSLWLGVCDASADLWPEAVDAGQDRLNLFKQGQEHAMQETHMGSGSIFRDSTALYTRACSRHGCPPEIHSRLELPVCRRTRTKTCLWLWGTPCLLWQQR